MVLNGSFVIVVLYPIASVRRYDTNSAWIQSGLAAMKEAAAYTAIANGQGAAKMNVRLDMARGY